jgi:hypothetical protein
MQDACRFGGYVQEGRGGPAGSSQTQPAVPKAMRCEASTLEIIAMKRARTTVLRQSGC